MKGGFFVWTILSPRFISRLICVNRAGAIFLSNERKGICPNSNNTIVVVSWKKIPLKRGKHMQRRGANSLSCTQGK